MKERYSLLLIIGVFLAAYYVPWSDPLVRQSGLESFLMLQEYAQEHVLTCLIPAMFIAGAIAVFVSQAAVIKYFGAGAKKIIAYSVASVSGTILAVCSCTVLPLFASIYMRGGGIGPATSFLYSGPAINVLAIVLTARVLGWKLGLARAVGAVGFAFIIGLAMHFIYLREEKTRIAGKLFLPDEEDKTRPLWKEVLYMATLVGILIFAVAVWWLRSSGRLAPEEPDAGGCRDAMVLGAVCALAALLPVTASNRGVELGNSYDRYTLTAMLGVCMFVSGFIFTAIASHGFRVGAVAVLVGLGIGTHFANASAAAELESVHRQFWWQLSWRAPDLQSGTVVVPLLRSTYRFVDDYDVFPPLNILYRPGVQAIEIPAQILNRDSAKKMVLSGSDERDLRTILFTRDYDNLLVISYGYDSGASTCLHAIDGRQLELSQNEDPLVPLVAPNSKVDRISVDGSPHRPPEVFFGAEPPHTWCYYYQKASLARQKGNWAEVARLGDEAAAQNFTPADRLEWMPFLEGYANLRRYDRVTEIAAAMKLKDRQMVASVCRRFAPGQAAPANYADADAYPFVVRTLCEQEP